MPIPKNPPMERSNHNFGLFGIFLFTVNGVRNIIVKRILNIVNKYALIMFKAIPIKYIAIAYKSAAIKASVKPVFEIFSLFTCETKIPDITRRDPVISSIPGICDEKIIENTNKK